MKRRSVLFVCIGNSCRSQMAEGFALAYGSDVVEAASAGVAPAMTVAPLTRQVMIEKNILLDAHFPKGLEFFQGRQFDLVVNMSGRPLPPGVESQEVREWLVPDPVGENEGFHRQVRDQLEGLVMRLILELRAARGTPPPGPGEGAMRVRFRGVAPARKN